MPTGDHEDAVRQFMAALESEGDLNVLDAICTPEIAEEWRSNMEAFEFSERTFTVDEIVAQESKVAILWSIAATHTAQVAGIPATGKRTANTGSAFFRFEGGRISSVVSHYDADNLYRQLGAEIGPARNGA